MSKKNRNFYPSQLSFVTFFSLVRPMPLLLFPLSFYFALLFVLV